MKKYKKIGSDYYFKVGSVRNRKVYDGQCRIVGEVGKQSTIERNQETTIKGRNQTFKIINDKVFNSQNKQIGTVSQFRNMIDGSVSGNELADVVAFLCLIQ